MMDFQFYLKLSDIHKYYQNNHDIVKALNGVNFTFQNGDFIILAGANGSGKTTLLNLISGVEKQNKGLIEMKISKNQNDEILRNSSLKKKISIVHQSVGKGTIPNMTVMDNFRFAFLRNKQKSIFKYKISDNNRHYVYSRLKKFQLENKIDSFISDLSQGQRQLIAMELALINNPYILLLDEHTAALDPLNRELCIDATKEYSNENRITVMVTHSIDLIKNTGNKLIILNNGKVDKVLDKNHKDSLDFRQLYKLINF